MFRATCATALANFVYLLEPVVATGISIKSGILICLPNMGYKMNLIKWIVVSSMICVSFFYSLTSANDAVDMKMSLVTIAVDGMMKSKSGAT